MFNGMNGLEILANWPRFEDGELVKIEDEFSNGDCQRDFVAGIEFNEGGVSVDAMFGKSINLNPGERVEHPEPEVLDADGVPIKQDDTVYIIDASCNCLNGFESGDECTVISIAASELYSIMVRKNTVDGFTLTGYAELSNLTHTKPEPPDTQERIDADARKEYFDYWGCRGGICRECPAMVGGLKPHERLGAATCSSAQAVDLLRRQRELDAKGGE